MHSAVIDTRTGRKGVDGPMEWARTSFGGFPARWELVIPHLLGGIRVGQLSTAIFVFEDGHVEGIGRLSFNSVEEAKAYVEATYALEE